MAKVKNVRTVCVCLEVVELAHITATAHSSKFALVKSVGENLAKPLKIVKNWEVVFLVTNKVFAQVCQDF